MQKWEYKAFNCLLDQDELNRLGSKGWELVAVVIAGGDYISGAYTYLKRPLSN